MRTDLQVLKPLTNKTMNTINTPPSKTERKAIELDRAIKGSRQEPVVGLTDFAYSCREAFDDAEIKLLIKLLQAKLNK